LRATVSNNQANLNLATRTINQLTNNAEDGTVTFDFSQAENLNAVRLPRTGLTAFAEAGLAVEIRLPVGTITLNQNALSSILQQGNEPFITISIGVVVSSSLSNNQRRAIGQNEQAFRITVRRGTTPITSFAEDITITLPHEGDFPAAVWQLNNDGTRVRMQSTYNMEAETVTFSTSQLSVYVVGHDNNPVSAPTTP